MSIDPSKNGGFGVSPESSASPGRPDQTASNDPGTAIFDDPDFGRARKLLALCGPSSPFERLVDRLERPDSPSWVRTVLSDATAGLGVDASSVVSDGAGGLSAAIALKDAGKNWLRGTKGNGSKEPAVLLYSLGVATAAFHFGEMISSRPADVVADNFLILAGVLPDPFSRVVAGAVGRL